MTQLTRPAPVEMGDAITAAGIPMSVRYAAPYRNGLYQWSDPAISRFLGTVEIAVYSGQPQQAKIARVLDTERFDATVEDAAPFLSERQDLGHSDGTIYISLDNIAPLVEALQADPAVWAGSWRLWVAWWWLKSRPPTMAELVAAVTAAAKYPIPWQRLWGVQWEHNENWDRSLVYGPLDFVRHPVEKGGENK